MVIKILKNEKYAGDLVQKKSYTPDFLTHEKRRNTGQVPLITIREHHEPIISREIWDLAQERLARNNKHRAGEGGHSNRYIFSGRIRCGRCGSSFTARYRRLADGTKLRRWCCTTGCGIGKIIRDDDAMQMLKSAVRSLPLDADALIRDVTALALEVVLAGQAVVRDDPERLRFDAERIRRKKEAVMDSYFAGDIPKTEMQTMRSKYDRQIAGLRRRCQEAEQRCADSQDPDAVRTRLQRLIADILCGRTESAVFCKSILDQLTVFPDRHLELRLNGCPMVFHFL